MPKSKLFFQKIRKLNLCSPIRNSDIRSLSNNNIESRSDVRTIKLAIYYQFYKQTTNTFTPIFYALRRKVNIHLVLY